MVRKALTKIARGSPPDEAVAIVFGHNAADRKVLMYFPPPVAFQIVYSPEEARDVAAKLVHYADMADGKKGM